MSVTATTKPAATASNPEVKKPGPAKKLKAHAYITVEKNSYAKKVSELANSGATILAVTINQDIRNAFDVHYFTLQ